MSLEAFHHSEPLTLGVELELQLVNTNDYDLAPYAEDIDALLVVQCGSNRLQLKADLAKTSIARRLL